MKVIKRNYEHRNVIFFLIFSMVYLQAIYSLSRGISIFTIESVTLFLKNHYLILILNLFTIYTVLTLKRYSDKVLMVCLALIAGKNFVLLSASFNKLILGLSFAYLIFAFYFFVMWELETTKASSNPNFSRYDLEIPTRFPLLGKVESANGDKVFEVHITNIDNESCFTFLPADSAKALINELDSEAQYKLMADLEGVTFTQMAHLVSTYDRGLGFVLIKEKLDDRTLNWSDLYKVCLDRGLFA